MMDDNSRSTSSSGRNSRRRTELIFYQNQSSNRLFDSNSDPGNQVDLEIILLGPDARSKRPLALKGQSDRRNNGTDTENDESYDNNDNNLGAKSEGQSRKTEDVPADGRSDNSKKSKSPKISERLLERLERRYKKKDDDLYIDYMDYF